MHGETNLMITYDVTCQKLSRLARLRHNQTVGKFPRQHISPRKVNYGFSKKFETAEIHIFNYPETFKGMGKFLVYNFPLFHQIFMNIRGLFICQTPIETNNFSNTTY